jgi:GT2 family glycosyltransferase/glycosyltransferase involved in cell wall biosynthesis
MIVIRPVLALIVFAIACAALGCVALAVILIRVLGRFRRRPPLGTRTSSAIGVSIVIPTWNGRTLLEECLPSIVEDVAATEGFHEIIVVDNASTDDSVAFVADQFPFVRVIRLDSNGGFGEACNAGARAATGRFVVALNNDMKVERGFLRELIAGFQHPDTFAVTAQIFFWDQGRRREETGLTRGAFSRGQLSLTHVVPGDVGHLLPPVFYAGGGSTAYDREKFLDLGGFDELYHPFYVEDVDLSYRAWRRGWPSVFAPTARVHHKHRGTIGKYYDADYIRNVVDRNRILFVWRNVSDPRILASGVLAQAGLLAAGALRGAMNARPLRLAFARLPDVVGRIWRERRADEYSDEQVVRLATDLGYYRDQCVPVSIPRLGDRLKIVMMSPYAMFPPRHGGAARMYNIVRRLAYRHDVHLLSYVDSEEEQSEMADLETQEIRVTTVLRRPEYRPYYALGSDPLCVVDFDMPQMREALRSPAVVEADILHVEYTQMALFIRPSRHILNVLAEVDVSFLSMYRAMRQLPWLTHRISAWYEWLKLFNYELDVCRRADLVLAVSHDERDLLRSYLSSPPISSAAPTGVDVHHFQPRDQLSVKPFSVLFVGYFRHPPNVDAVLWLAQTIFPRLKERHPSATLTIVGAHPPPEVARLAADTSVKVLGYVDEVRDCYRTHAVLAAPIRTGAGTRVKILEAMAAGVPVVTTTIGAEGIVCRDGVDILIADDVDAFTRGLEAILLSPSYAQSLAEAARQLVLTRYDWDAIVENLEQLYFDYLTQKRSASSHLLPGSVPASPSASPAV